MFTFWYYGYKIMTNLDALGIIINIIDNIILIAIDKS